MIKTEAIVLSHLKYGEHSVIATIYTQQMGRQSILVKGAFGRTAPMKASLFRPLYLLDVTLCYRSRRQLQYISNASINTPFLSVPYDPVKSGIALFLSEVLYRILREEEPNPALYAFLYQAIQLLDLNRAGTANFHLLFLLQLTRYMGFYPSENFTLETLVQDIPPERLQEDNALWNQFMQIGFDGLDTIQLSHERRNELLDIMLAYYAFHLEEPLVLHSKDVLKTLFS